MKNSLLVAVIAFILSGCSDSNKGSGLGPGYPASADIQGEIIDLDIDPNRDLDAERSVFRDLCKKLDGFSPAAPTQVGTEIITREDYIDFEWGDDASISTYKITEEVVPGKELMARVFSDSGAFSITADWRIQAGVGSHSSRMEKVISTQPANLMDLFNGSENSTDDELLRFCFGDSQDSTTQKAVKFKLKSGREISGLLEVATRSIENYVCEYRKEGSDVVVKTKKFDGPVMITSTRFYSAELVNPTKGSCQDDATLLSIEATKTADGKIVELYKEEVLGIK